MTNPKDVEIRRLKNRVEELLSLLGAKKADELCLLGLTPHEAIILSTLLNNVIVSTQFMHTVLYEDGWATPDVDGLRVHIFRVRHKLEAMGIDNAISTAFGYGYFLTSAGREAIKVKMQELGLHELSNSIDRQLPL